jgi:ADP-heptose:LPS heptosyltransferase
MRRSGILQAERPLVSMHAGGAWLHGLKRWPAERYSALADRLQEQWGAHIVLLGGAEDALLVSGIVAKMRHVPITATIGSSLLTSLALIEASDLFIGNDSSMLHAAAALGTPFLGIYGPTSVTNFGPIARAPGQGMVVTPRVPCRAPRYAVGGDVVWRRPECRGICGALASISVDAVYAEAAALLSRRWGLRDVETRA